MKKTKISFIIMLVIMIASLGSTQAFAQGQGKGEQHGKEGMPGGMCKGDKNMAFIKDLTVDQQKQIDALKMNLIKESISTKNLIEEKQAHLKTISTGDNVDMVAVNKTIDELFALKADMTKKHEAFKQDVRKLLTTDQKVMFDIHAGKGHREGGEMKGMGKGCDMKGMENGGCKMDGNGHGMGMGNGEMKGCSQMGSGSGCCKDKAAGCNKDKENGEGCKGKGGDGQGNSKMQGCEGHGQGKGDDAGNCKKK
jgi:Spy/CpxP family protein refolding chaperone